MLDRELADLPPDLRWREWMLRVERSPVSTYEVARKLDEQSLLAGFLGVEHVRLAKGELQSDDFTSPSPIDLVPHVLADWQPKATLMGLELEQSLTLYLDRPNIRERLGNPLVEPCGPISAPISN